MERELRWNLVLYSFTPGHQQTLTMTEVVFDGEDVRVSHKLSRKLLKNVILISVAFLLLFTAYSGLSVLQSSLFHEEGMGVINQAILYAAAVLSFLFLPRLVIHRIGHKWTMALSSTGYVLLVAANGYAIWATMVPASRINGLCCGTLWTAKSSYVTLVAAKYASLHGEQKDVIIARFEGIFDFAKLLGGKCRSCWCQTKCIFHTTSSINIVSANGLAEVYISPVCLYMMGALCHTWNHQVFFLERLCVFIWGVHCVTHDIIKRFS